jgi:hypothetical protein
VLPERDRSQNICSDIGVSTTVSSKMFQNGESGLD